MHCVRKSPLYEGYISPQQVSTMCRQPGSKFEEEVLLRCYAIHAARLVEFYSSWLTFLKLLLECIKYTPGRWFLKGSNKLEWRIDLVIHDCMCCMIEAHASCLCTRTKSNLHPANTVATPDIPRSRSSQTMCVSTRSSATLRTDLYSEALVLFPTAKLEHRFSMPCHDTLFDIVASTHTWRLSQSRI
jgi:hypothetical protein